MRRLAMMIVAVVFVFISGCATTDEWSGGFLPASLHDNEDSMFVVNLIGRIDTRDLEWYTDSVDRTGIDAKWHHEQLEKLKQQQNQIQQAKVEKLQTNTRLSAPVALLLSDNQAAVARNGCELSSILLHIQPGAMFNLLTKKADVEAVQNDMMANGYIAIGAPTQQGQNTMLVFQKPQQAAPVFESL